MDEFLKSQRGILSSITAYNNDKMVEVFNFNMTIHNKDNNFASYSEFKTTPVSNYIR